MDEIKNAAGRPKKRAAPLTDDKENVASTEAKGKGGKRKEGRKFGDVLPTASNSISAADLQLGANKLKPMKKLVNQPAKKVQGIGGAIQQGVMARRQHAAEEDETFSDW